MQEFQTQWTRFWKLMLVVAMVLSVVASTLAGLNFVAQGQEELTARGASVPCYMEQGGAKFVGESGCEIELQSGATLDLQSGATTDFSAGVDLDGAELTMDADADTSLTADTDDQLDVEINGADDFRFTANTFTALSGSSLAANTIAETTAGSGVTIDSLTLKDGGVQDAGGLPITGQADVNQLVVTGYTTQTNSLLVLEASGGADKLTVSNDGNLVVEGTSNLKGNVSDSGGTFTIGDNAAVTGQADANQLVVTGYTTQTNSLQVWEQSGGADVATMSNAGDLDLDGALNYGTNNLYALGYASSGYEVECGTTGTFTGSTTISASNLTTVTVPVAIQVTAPITTAAYLHASDPTTSTVTLTSLNNTFGAGTTGVVAHYCLLGQD
jgi:hypothetical protein